MVYSYYLPRNLRWNNFTINKATILLVLIALTCLFTYQITAVLYVLPGYTVSWFSLTAVFLTLNSLLMCLLVFLLCSDKCASICDVISSHVPVGASLSKDVPEDDNAS